ncbi:MAG: M56 family metallopeptidase [Bacteroidales bacterium]|nr:M56 family metallopeptidase [Bacteroidales bacterium]
MKRIVDVGLTFKINMPVTLGHFKPVVLLPSRLLTGLSGDQLETILLHELAHIKRNDFLVNLIQGFLEVVFFYHPAIWWLSGAIRTEREHACDDLAIRGGANATSLAQALADLTLTIYKPEYSLAFSGKQHKIKNRIHRLILNENMKTNLKAKMIAATTILFSVAALSFSVKKRFITGLRIGS